ncbi:DUF6607 family protein [Permianibacter aggregans]|uniref:Secreted protein n=1 Tax=Permianibacter aggregans TaxID=1510150 RepID=A0A4R6UHE0_9GAMM|nr:DUF6607 family protein [Permianibacter aggregans]QGX39945.1 hypothetical protein E2H98_09845 [Permianibacter aggregans]TDQ46248.1 hypothetical protein EV696_11433 [Permianibacter aggregans]
MNRVFLSILSALMLSACQTATVKKNTDVAAAPEKDKAEKTYQVEYPLVTTKLVGCQPHEKKFDCDRRAILAMTGEYQVDFHFEEVAGYRAEYQTKAPYKSRGFEFVKLIEDDGTRIVLQHVLVSKEGHVVKHWRQDWEYEQTSTWQFTGDRSWARRTIPTEQVKGSWVQTVWQVDDSPRYAGVGAWQHHSNVSSWNSDVTWRPLPRREFTSRSDYDVLEARNRHEIHSSGWLHLQDNLKRDQQAESDQRYIAREIGIDRYTRISGYDFAKGYEYWQKTAEFWQIVRQSWAELFARHQRIALHNKVDDKTLWMVMFELADKPLPSDTVAQRKQVNQVLQRYLKQQEIEMQKTAIR